MIPKMGRLCNESQFLISTKRPNLTVRKVDGVITEGKTTRERMNRSYVNGLWEGGRVKPIVRLTD